MKKILPLLNRYKNFVLGLVIVGLIGYTAYQISQITNVTADAAAVQTAIDTRNASNIRLNTKAIDVLSNSLIISVDASPGDTGKSDPFNP